jgi:hypothetical protein
MLHWTWQPTTLQPTFTGHGMFSGTGFITKEGQPAAIYHGQGSKRNQIAIAKDRKLTAWEKPYPMDVFNVDSWSPLVLQMLLDAVSKTLRKNCLLFIVTCLKSQRNWKVLL